MRTVLVPSRCCGDRHKILGKPQQGQPVLVLDVVGAVSAGQLAALGKDGVPDHAQQRE
ncbi:hypothetical protein [Saccharopolyspora sp. 5N708]|uniref:hypothetical protein n=1 Tax=Saccharopolyspora sp. 5N708 TaxID=3457424 RepID=UPI003FD08FAF